MLLTLSFARCKLCPSYWVLSVAPSAQLSGWGSWLVQDSSEDVWFCDSLTFCNGLHLLGVNLVFLWGQVSIAELEAFEPEDKLVMVECDVVCSWSFKLSDNAFVIDSFSFSLTSKHLQCCGCLGWLCLLCQASLWKHLLPLWVQRVVIVTWTFPWGVGCYH